MGYIKLHWFGLKLKQDVGANHADLGIWIYFEKMKDRPRSCRQELDAEDVLTSWTLRSEWLEGDFRPAYLIQGEAPLFGSIYLEYLKKMLCFNILLLGVLTLPSLSYSLSLSSSQPATTQLNKTDTPPNQYTPETLLEMRMLDLLFRYPTLQVISIHLFPRNNPSATYTDFTRLSIEARTANNLPPITKLETDYDPDVGRWTVPELSHGTPFDRCWPWDTHRVELETAMDLAIVATRSHEPVVFESVVLTDSLDWGKTYVFSVAGLENYMRVLFNGHIVPPTETGPLEVF